jgi:hypothetical protein
MKETASGHQPIDYAIKNIIQRSMHPALNDRFKAKKQFPTAFAQPEELK